MAFTTGSFALKGLRQCGLWPLDPEDDTQRLEGFLLPYPSKAEFTEEQETKEIPGGDVVADKSLNLKGGTLVLGWSRLKLSQVAALLGSTYEVTGDAPNRVLTLKRRTTDVPPYFAYEGRCRYLGSSFPNADFRMIGHKGKLVGSPKIPFQTGEYVSLEMSIFFEERSDGEFYELKAMETASEITETLDTTAPTISSVSPADNAVGVAIAGNITITFSEAIRYVPEHFRLQSIQTPGSAITNVAVTKSINDAKTVVTMAYTGLANNRAHNISISGAIEDLAGNKIAGPADYQFTTVA